MGHFEIRTLGELQVLRDGAPLRLPASRRTRALLAYLALTGRPHRRERLCELLWEVPDDPRGALRWSLSKLRPVVNDAHGERLCADRERVELRCGDEQVDLRRIAHRLDTPMPSLAELDAIVAALAEPLLGGSDVPDQPSFQQWLLAEREHVERLRARALGLRAGHPELAAEQRLPAARAWCAGEPFNPDAATLLVARLRQFGRADEAQRTAAGYAARFAALGIAWSAQASPTNPAPIPQASPLSSRQYLTRQKIQFCSAADGARIAYATVGSGPPIVKAANWLSHLELDWDAPIWSPLFRALARDHRFIRYDERGNGLSDWAVAEVGFDAFVTDLETVVDAAGVERFALLGISQGAAVSIEYAARHPERVSRLILFGGYPAGWRVDAGAALVREREAIMTLTASGWGADNPAYRQIFSSTFMPGATDDELRWFNAFQRATTSPENAVRFLSAFGDIDVRARLAELRVPTLVIHSLGDQRIPAATGRELAARIPGAQFLGLDSDNHLLLGREPASQLFLDAVNAFLAEG